MSQLHNVRPSGSFPVLLVALVLPVAPAAAADGFMSVQDFQFAPAVAQIQPGESVAFNFEGPSAHNAVIRGGQVDRYDSGITGPGFTKTHRFRYPGSFSLLCDIHERMTARVLVGARETMKPQLSRLRARAGAREVKLTFRSSERTVVSVSIGSRRARKVLSAGTRTITVARLRPGRRTAKVSARDGWGNRSAIVKRSFTVR